MLYIRHFHSARVTISADRGGACDTRQPRSQGPASIQAHRTGEVTGSEGQEGANGVGGGIGVGGGNRGGNGDLNDQGDGDGAGTGAGAGAGTGRERGWRPVDEHRMGTGTEARTVAEMGTGTRIGSGRAEERRKRASNRKMVVDAMRETGET